MQKKDDFTAEDNDKSQYIHKLETRINQLEAQLEQQKTDTQNLELHKIDLIQSFIRDASHEFRTPLSSINTALYMLHRLDEDNRLAKYLDRIDEESKLISELVDDLLVMTRLDSGVPLEHEAVDVNILVCQLVEKHRSEMVGGKHRLQFECKEFECVVDGDAYYLTMAIDALLDNARRFSKRGGVIHVEVEKQTHNLCIKIIDEGIGIPADALPHIFERFFRVDEAHSTSGFGLGLAIAHKIVAYHKGSIQIASEVDKGTTCTLLLPCHQHKFK